MKLILIFLNTQLQFSLCLGVFVVQFYELRKLESKVKIVLSLNDLIYLLNYYQDSIFQPSFSANFFNLAVGLTAMVFPNNTIW
jgi:hypothetical protein